MALQIRLGAKVGHDLDPHPWWYQVPVVEMMFRRVGGDCLSGSDEPLYVLVVEIERRVLNFSESQKLIILND